MTHSAMDGFITSIFKNNNNKKHCFVSNFIVLCVVTVKEIELSDSDMITMWSRYTADLISS